MSKLSDLMADPRFGQMETEDRLNALDKFFDAEIEAGRFDELDRAKTKQMTQIKSDYENETDIAKGFMKRKYEALTALHAQTRGANEKQKQLATQRFSMFNDSLQREQMTHLNELAQASALAATILNGDEEEIQKTKNEKNYAQRFGEYLAEGAEGLWSMVGDNDENEWFGANPRDKRKWQAEKARKQLAQIGFKSKESQNKIVEDLRKLMLHKFEDKNDVGLVNHFGEVTFNDESLLRLTDSQIREKLEEKGVPKNAIERAMDSLDEQREAAWEQSKSAMGNWEKMPGATREEKIDNYLSKTENRNEFYNFLEGSFNRI